MLNYFKDSEDTASGVCRILSKEELPLLFSQPLRRQGTGNFPKEIFKISRVAIAVKKLPRRRRQKKMRRVDESVE